MASEQRLDQLAADYIAGSLSSEDAMEFARLIDTSSELRTTVNRLEKTVGLILNELPLEAPPQRLKTSILAAIETPSTEALAVDTPVANTSNAQSNSRRLLRLTWGLGALATATALLSIALGLNNHRLRLANQQLDKQLSATLPAQEAQTILQQPATQFYDFEGTDNNGQVSGNMIVNRDNLRAAIAFQNLPPLPETQTYALWVVRQGEYIPCGEFQANAEGQAFDTLDMPKVYQSKPWVKDVIVTVESTIVPAQPNGPIVAQTKIT